MDSDWEEEKVNRSDFETTVFEWVNEVRREPSTVLFCFHFVSSSVGECVGSILLFR